MNLTYRQVRPYQGQARCVLVATDSSHWDDTHVVLKPQFVGVCRSDLKELQGTRHGRRDFGHEIVAEVIHTPSRSALPNGSWVVLDPHVPITRDSGFSELVVMRGTARALERSVVPLAASPHRAGVFVEPLACVEHALAHMAVPPTARWLILGAGHAGFLMYAVLHSEQRPVQLANRSPQRLTELAAAGLAREGDVLGWDELESASYDGVCVATAMASTDIVESAAKAVRRGGRLHVYGGTSPDFPLWRGCNLDTLRRNCLEATVDGPNGELEVSGSHGASRQHFERSIARLGLGRRSPSLTELGSKTLCLIGPETDLDGLAHILNHGGSASTRKPILVLPDAPPSAPDAAHLDTGTRAPEPSSTASQRGHRMKPTTSQRARAVTGAVRYHENSKHRGFEC